VLCTLVNKISANSVKKFKNSKMPFVQRENITKYMKACKKLGMRENDAFVTDDLFNANDLSVVLMQIFALSKVSESIRSFNGPYIQDFQDGDIIPQQVSLVDSNSAAAPSPVTGNVAAPPKAKKSGPPPPPAAAKPPPLPSRASITSKSNAAPQRVPQHSVPKAPAKKPRKLQSVLQKQAVNNPDNPLVPKTDRKRGGKMAEIERLVGGSSRAPPPKPKTMPPPRPAGAKSMTSRPNPQFQNREEECVWWVQTVSGVPVNGGFQDGLKSGVALCTLVNTIAPGTIKKFRNKAKLSKFECLENIAAYLKGVKKLGVKQHELFVSNDLYEANSLRQVANSIVAFSNISRDIASFNGPYIGIAVTKKNERHFTAEQRAKANAAIPFTSTGSVYREKERKLDKIIRH